MVVGARAGGDAAGGSARDVRHHDQELSSRARGAERTHRGAARVEEFHQLESGRSRRARGWANVLSTARKYSEITENLGETYEIAVNSYKPFPCGVVIHPAIDGALQLAQGAQARRRADRAHRTEGPSAGAGADRQETPQTGLEGKFSVYHAVAAAIVRGAVGEQEFSDAAVRDPGIVALRGRVTAAVDAVDRRGSGGDRDHD